MIKGSWFCLVRVLPNLKHQKKDAVLLDEEGTKVFIFKR